VDHNSAAVGSWKCGGAPFQPNQMFSFDAVTGMVVSLDTSDTSHAGGLCLTVSSAQ
jgi:hypothetical protein